jgi:hypothetical protein
MDKAFIFHGTGAGPYDHWFPEIKQKLEAEGVEVAVPEFQELWKKLENFL